MRTGGISRPSHSWGLVYCGCSRSPCAWLSSSVEAALPSSVSGAGTDSSEKGKIIWARVKGRTENYILNLGFKDAYMFRPALIAPTEGLNNTLTLYKFFAPLIPFVKLFSPKHICSLKQIGLAMINSVLKGYDNKILEVIDIKKLSGV